MKALKIILQLLFNIRNAYRTLIYGRGYSYRFFNNVVYTPGGGNDLWAFVRVAAGVTISWAVILWWLFNFVYTTPHY